MTGMTGSLELDELALSVAADNGPSNAGQPMDIGYLALFLGSDEAKFINGTVIPADGGWIAR
jgi:NAD(P)-dependent dehydrogenase (short-subunit alcohol dehydrogenase family)